MLQADLKTFMAFETFGMSVLTACTGESLLTGLLTAPPEAETGPPLPRRHGKRLLAGTRCERVKQ